MIKKIIFAFFILFISLCINNLLMYNELITINILSYQINTTTGFLFLFFFFLQFFIYLIFYIFCILFNSNFKNFDTKKHKFENKFDKYINLINESLIYKDIDLKIAFKKLKEANKIYKSTNLSKLVESKLYYINNEFDKSKTTFKEINNKSINIDLVYSRLELIQELKNNNNQSKIKELSEKILKLEPTNKIAIENLLNIYTQNKNWSEAINILNIGLKTKIFNKNKLKDKISFLYTSYAKELYEKNNYNEAKVNLKIAFKINNKSLETAILLVKTYIILNRKNDALKIIKKIWKYETNKELLDLYFSIKNKNYKNCLKLYKINPKSFESNYIMAESFFNKEFYSKSRKHLKIAENIEERKELYELMLKIEEKDNGSSALKNNIQNKISNTKIKKWKCNFCKKEFNSWQSQCDNCLNLNSINWD